MLIKLLLYAHFLLHLSSSDVTNTWQCIAVVEYKAISDSSLTPNEILEKNAMEYDTIVEKLRIDYSTVLVVFPEATLDNVQEKEDLREYSSQINVRENPCTTHSRNYPKFVQILSCAARRTDTYIVFNLIEEFNSEYYTSDVGIDSGGNIFFKREDRIGVSFLRKPPIPFVVPIRFVFPVLLIPDDTIMELKLLLFNPTSFVTGFRFSFEKAIFLEEYRNYLICSNWISQLPFLTSLQVYQMWAQEFNITIFFAGANNPEKGQGGTGIYHAVKGPITMNIVGNGGTKTYVYNFSDTDPGFVMPPVENKTIDELSKEMDNFYTEVDPDLYRYSSRVVNPEQKKFDVELCSNHHVGNHFCCNFHLELSQKNITKSRNRYTYHLIAYRGYKTYHKIFQPGGVELCALIACLNSSISSCGQRFPKFEDITWPVVFKQVVVKAKFGLPRKERIYYSSQFPSSLLSSMRPIHPDLTKWTGKNITDNTSRASYFERTFYLTEPQTKILTFGIFGRNFTLVEPKPPNCAESLLSSPLLIHVLFSFAALAK